MEISVDSLREGCCEALESRQYIDMDVKIKALDGTLASCDKVIECEDNYIFIEEKSFLLDFFNKAASEIGYKGHIEESKIKPEFLAEQDCS